MTEMEVLKEGGVYPDDLIAFQPVVLMHSGRELITLQFGRSNETTFCCLGVGAFNVNGDQIVGSHSVIGGSATRYHKDKDDEVLAAKAALTNTIAPLQRSRREYIWDLVRCALPEVVGI